jgi:hypothetical protein
MYYKVPPDVQAERDQRRMGILKDEKTRYTDSQSQSALDDEIAATQKKLGPGPMGPPEAEQPQRSRFNAGSGKIETPNALVKSVYTPDEALEDVKSAGRGAVGALSLPGGLSDLISAPSIAACGLTSSTISGAAARRISSG